MSAVWWVLVLAGVGCVGIGLAYTGIWASEKRMRNRNRGT